MDKNQKKEKDFFQKKPLSFWVLIIVVSILLLFSLSKIGTVTLWGDESYRAMIAQSTLLNGYPTHWSGFQYTVGVDEKFLSHLFPGKYVEISSWFQYYIIALSYKLFGINTFTTRLPFFIGGLLIVYTLYKYRNFFQKKDKVFTLTSIMLLLNFTFFIYVQQANYYIYALLFTLLSSFLFFDIFNNKKPYPIPKLFILFLVNLLLAHTHIPTAVTLFIVQSGFIAQSLLKKSMKIRIVAGTYLLFSAIFLFLSVKLYSSSDALTLGKYFWISIVIFLNQLNFYIFPFIALIFLVFVGIRFRDKIMGKKWLLYVTLVTVLHILLISYFNFVGAMPFRYISSYMVLWFISLAVVISSVPRIYAIVLFLFVVSINIFTGISKLSTFVFIPKPLIDMVKREMPTIPLISEYPVRCYYCEFLGEITNSSPHPLSNVIQVLNLLDVKKKKIIVGPCEGNTIMFYTGGIVIDQMPKILYEKIYKKAYEITDADVIVNNAFCPWELDHKKTIAMGYKFQTIALSQKAFIHDGELNVRSKFVYPFAPYAIIYYKDHAVNSDIFLQN